MLVFLKILEAGGVLVTWLTQAAWGAMDAACGHLAAPRQRSSRSLRPHCFQWGLDWCCWLPEAASDAPVGEELLATLWTQGEVLLPSAGFSHLVPGWQGFVSCSSQAWASPITQRCDALQRVLVPELSRWARCPQPHCGVSNGANAGKGSSESELGAALAQAGVTA